MQDCVENAECLQAKRKFKMENDTEVGIARSFFDVLVFA